MKKNTEILLIAIAVLPSILLVFGIGTVYAHLEDPSNQNIVNSHHARMHGMMSDRHDCPHMGGFTESYMESMMECPMESFHDMGGGC